jgi:hypothetical protein
MTNDLAGVLGSVRKQEKGHVNRVYHPKIRTDLTIERKVG